MGVERKLLREFSKLVGNTASLSLAVDNLENILVKKGILEKGELEAAMRKTNSDATGEF